MSQKLKEKSLSPEIQASSISSRANAMIGEVSEFDERIQRVLHAAGEKKALEPTVLDLREIASFTDFFVIFTGANRRQVQAISDEVVEQLKRHGSPAARVEGYQNAEWILIDYGDLSCTCSMTKHGAFTISNACGARPGVTTSHPTRLDRRRLV